MTLYGFTTLPFQSVTVGFFVVGLTISNVSHTVTQACKLTNYVHRPCTIYGRRLSIINTGFFAFSYDECYILYFFRTVIYG